MSDAAHPGDWVQVHRVVLAADRRTGKLPDDTRAVPFESWSKGFACATARLGDEVEIETLCGRRVVGSLVAVNPGYEHGFGSAYVPELLTIARQARALLAEGSAGRDR